MAWDYKQYADYVRKHAPPAEQRSLLQAASRPYSAQHPKIFLTFYSMPDWLDVFGSVLGLGGSARRPVDFEKRLTTTPFNQMIAEYKRAAKKHEDKVAEALDIIVTLPSGLALLKEIGRTRYTIRVMPYWHHFRTMPGSGFPGSTSRPLLPGESLSHISDGTFANDKDVYARNAPVREDDGDPIPGETGTGKGANVVLFFSAENWESSLEQRNPGFEADEVLFHELVHVTRMFRGLMTRCPIEGRGGYGNVEEFFATVITNVYMSDKGKTRLRGLYSNELIRPRRREVMVNNKVVMVITDPLPRDWSVMKEPDKFYDNVDKLSIPPRELMKGFSTTQPNFYLALAHLPADWPRFNPVRRHFRENLRLDI